MKHNNLWAPWRTEYLKSLGAEKPSDESQGCFLCAYWNDPEHDQENLVLWRTRLCQVVFNRFPYTGGHLIIAPATHVSDLNQLDEATLLEMMLLARQAQTIISQAIKPDGFNLGINTNQSAGAGLPDHIHMHLVPRWVGDTNFMAVTGHVRIISQGFDELYQLFRQAAQELNLPKVPD